MQDIPDGEDTPHVEIVGRGEYLREVAGRVLARVAVGLACGALVFAALSFSPELAQATKRVLAGGAGFSALLLGPKLYAWLATILPP